MFVYLNGSLVRSDRENNILSDLPLGIDAIVVFRRDSYKAPAKGFRTIHEFRNLTQVHVNFQSFDERKKVAFESDIIKGGGWRYCDEIECIFITDSTKTYSDYCVAKFEKYEAITDRFSDHYHRAYLHADKALSNPHNEGLKLILEKLDITHLGTMRDLLANAYMAGCNRE